MRGRAARLTLAICLVAAACGGNTAPQTSTATTSPVATFPAGVGDRCADHVRGYLSELDRKLQDVDTTLSLEELARTPVGQALTQLSIEFQESDPCEERETELLTIPLLLEVSSGEPIRQNFLRFIEENALALSARGWDLYPLCRGFIASG